jgi:ADP-L-glycero-D-manno-heptose 6-epimerase
MILITGGAGFIGSNLAAKLEERGMGPLLIVDRLGAESKWRNIAKRQLFDLAPPEELQPLLRQHRDRIDAIFHLGAISDTSWQDADAIVRNNVRLSFDLWDWCAANAVPLLYASSAATYGDGTCGFSDAHADLGKLRPLNLYGWSKHVVDRRFVHVAESGGATPPRWVGFKFFNVFGPNEYHKGSMRSAVAKLVDDALANAPARLFKSDRVDISDGEQRRDFVCVDDAVDAMIFMLRQASANGIFNVGSGKARSFADLGKAVFAALDRAPKLEFIDFPDALRGRYQYFTQAELSKLRAAGWSKPTISLEEGVANYVTGYATAVDPYR